MKRVYIAVGLFLIAAGFSRPLRADDSMIPPGPLDLNWGPDKYMEKRVEKAFNTLKGNLVDLTPDQLKAIRADMEAQAAQIDTLRLDYIEKLKAIRTDTDSKITSGMTPDQTQKYLDIKGRLWKIEQFNVPIPVEEGPKQEDLDKYKG